MNTDDFNEENSEDIEENEKPAANNDLVKKIIIGVLIVVAIVVCYLAFFDNSSNNNDNNNNNNNNNTENVTLKTSVIDIKIGEYVPIEYEPANADIKFTIADRNVAIVDSTGVVYGMGEGSTVVTMTYVSNGETKELICTVNVTKNAEGQVVSNNPPELNLSLANAQDGEWSRNNVLINVKASSETGKVTVKYTLNCTGDECNYNDVVGNLITMNTSGDYNVTVVATDANGSTTKSIKVKIDKDPPKITLDTDKTNIVSGSDIKVCAKCEDKDSGCVEEQVCKTYSESLSNQVLSVEDKAGNKVNSEVFNVAIDKNPPTCKLTANGNEVVASYSSNAVAYGFDKTFDGSTSTSVSISNPSEAGEYSTKQVHFYVKNSIGTIGECQITVYKKGSCYKCNGECYRNRDVEYKDEVKYEQNAGGDGTSVAVDPSKCGNEATTCFKNVYKKVNVVNAACKQSGYAYWNPGINYQWGSQNAK